MMVDLTDVMDEEIKREVSKIENLDPEKPEYARAIEGLAKLYKERVTQYATDVDAGAKAEAAKDEKELNEAKIRLEEDRLKLDSDRLELDKRRADIDQNKVDAEKARDEIEKERLAIERERLDLERQKNEIEAKRLKHEKSEGWVRVGMDVCGAVLKTAVETAAIVVPVIFYGEWIKEGLKFEQTGAFTSGTLRTFIGKLKPTKK
jgi:DNA repair exonuclease SbcCD ATPase subunit